jgi:hypothetical protein
VTREDDARLCEAWAEEAEATAAHYEAIARARRVRAQVDPHCDRAQQIADAEWYEGAAQDCRKRADYWRSTRRAA